MRSTYEKESRRLLLAGSLLLGTMLLFGSAQRLQAEPDQRGYLGVYLEALDDEERVSLKYEESGGVMVEEVVKDGPADKAGIKEDDIIIGFNGKKVESDSQLRELIQQAKPGDKVKVEIFRESEKKSVTVELGKASDLPLVDMGKTRKKIAITMDLPDRPCLGVEVQNLSDQLAVYFKVKAGEGVLVSSVQKDSPAEKAGLKAGDIIVKLDDETISRRADLIDELGEAKAGQEVTVAIIRDGKTSTLKATLAEAPEDCCPSNRGMGRALGRGGCCNMMKDFDMEIEGLGPEFMKYYQSNDLPVMQELREQMDELRQELDEMKKELEK